MTDHAALQHAPEPHEPPDLDVPGGAGGRLVVLSNRVLLPGQTHAGGLGQAMRTLLECQGGLWLGWSGTVCDAPQVHERNVGRVSYVTTDLHEADYAGYYGAFANGALWPLLHGRADLVRFDAAALEAYERVNAQFADLAMRELRNEDTVWVHDYHLLPLARLLRQRGFRGRIGFFLHTTLTSAALLATLPRHAQVFGALVDYDLVGLQTERDVAALRSYFEREFGGTSLGDVVRLGDGRRVRLDAFPIGIDTHLVAAQARLASRRDAVRALRASLGDRALLIGVDRLDYTKGVPERLQAFGRMLRNAPELAERCTFLQIAPPSRSELGDYRELENNVRHAAAAINGEHATVAWTPLRYVNRSYAHDDLTGFYRMARVGVVTPLRDGMNLVAKEYVASQDPADPGVLVLSRFAGAACELDSALQVNPLNEGQCALALQQALAMPLDERRARWTRMMQRLQQHDLTQWSARFLTALRAERVSLQPLQQAMPMQAFQSSDAWSSPGAYAIAR